MLTRTPKADWLWRLGGERRAFEGNRPLILSDPDSVWIVLSGSMAIFAGTTERGRLSGPRRRLFCVQPGDLMFGSALREEGGRVLVAFSLEKSELMRIGTSPFADVASDQSGPRKLVGDWIRKLDLALDGAGKLRDREVDPHSLTEVLATVHREFFELIDLSSRHDQERLASRLRERAVLSESAVQDVLRNLAGLAHKGQREALPRRGDTLFCAARIVGNAMGIELHPPRPVGAGSSAPATIREIEHSSHIRTRKVMITGNWWKSDSGPLLGFTLQDGRPVALVPRGSTRYDMIDPGTMRREPVTAAVASALQPYAHMFYRPLPESVLKPWDVFQFGLKGRARDIAAVLGAALAGTLLGMFTPIATSVLVDSAIPGSDRGLLLQLGLGLLAAALGKACFDLSEGFASARIGASSASSAQSAVWDRLLRLRLSFLRRYSSGDLLVRATAISGIQRRWSAATLRSIFSSFASLLNLALMFFYSGRLALLGVAAGLVMALLTAVCGAAALRVVRPLRLAQGRIFGLSVQLINGISKLRVSGAESAAFAFWGGKYFEQQKLSLLMQRIQDYAGAANQTIPTLASACILFAAGSLLVDPGAANPPLTTGGFLAFSVAFGSFVGAMVSLSNTAIETVGDLDLWQRAKPILEAELETDPCKADPGELAGRVSVDHVTFRYRESGPWTLENVSLHANPGEFIALAGPSGSGKSTIFRLLLGFETPRAGTVYYDGQDLIGLDVVSVRRQLGVVLQNSSLLSGSLYENIAAGSAVSLDEAWEAARRAGIADDIRALPMGMHTFISEGATNISAGQRQRMLIARALVFRPRILLFDEATSALDNRTQAIVSESLESLRVTRIVIAHRLSTIRKANRIYVIDGGRVVQEGTFDELRAREGLFARMMTRQML